MSDVFSLQLTVIHPKYGVEAASPGSSRLVSHQQMSRFAADLPTAHFISQSKAYAAAPGMEQGKIRRRKGEVRDLSVPGKSIFPTPFLFTFSQV